MLKNIAYMFPGQGAQYIGMGKELYEAFAESKEVFDKANEILKFDLTKLCFEGPKDELTNTANSQVAILTHSIAAFRVFEKYMDVQKEPSVQPETAEIPAEAEIPQEEKAQEADNPVPEEGVVQEPVLNADSYCPKFALGLSLGEYSALIANGCLSFEDAVMLVRKRGEFMDMAAKKTPGKMVFILGMEIGQVEELCKGIGGCEIANLNCPGQVIVSGKASNVELLAGLAKDKGAKRAMFLDVSGAFHSSLMTPAKEKLEKEIDKVQFNVPLYPVISNVTASPTQEPVEIKANLITQVNSRTLFEASIRYIASQGITTFIEIGPGTVQKGLLRKIDKTFQVINIEKPEHINGCVTA